MKGMQAASMIDEQQQASPISRVKRGYVLGVLTAIYCFNFMDRSILAVVLDPIKHEFQLTDTMMGFMIGPGFAATYAVLGVVMSRIADKIHRVGLISAGLGFWSLMTALTGLATGGWGIVGARLGVGIGESTGASPGQSLISDYYPKDKRPFAFSIYHWAPALGFWAALLIGGITAQHYGWRAAFFVAGIPGIVLAIVFFLTVKEPVRGLSDGAKVDRKHYNMSTTMKYLVTNKTYLLCVAGMLLAAYVNFTMSSWMPSYLRRVHRMTGSEIAYYAGSVKTIVGMVGAIVGGLFITRFAKGKDKLKLVIPGVTAVLAGPAFAIFFLSDPKWAMYLGLGLCAFFAVFGQGAVSGIIQTAVKVRMRAYASGLALLLANILAYSGAPLLVGILNDALKGRYGAHAVRYSMMLAVVATILAGICYFLAVRYVKEDIRKAAEDDLEAKQHARAQSA